MRLQDVDQSPTVAKKHYDSELEALQERMFRAHRHLVLGKKRAVVAIEGWDAAGKGGAIRRMTERLDPRGVRVHAIGAPTEEEQGRHYLYRFWSRLPVPGRLSVFDRTWYGRVLVERVEGFAEPARWQAAYDEINAMESSWVDDGIVLVKLFLHITKEEQLERFEARMNDPFKRWKLSREDIRNRARWEDYEAAVEAMFDKTHTPHAPWCVVGANHKRSARIQVLEKVCERLEAEVDVAAPIYDHSFVDEARAWLASERRRADGR